MSLGSQQYTVSTTAVAIANTYNDGNVWIVNGGTASIYLGAANVSSSNGLLLAKQDAPLNVTLHNGDVVYAITASGTATVSVLQT